MYRLYFQTFQGFRRKKILFNHKFPIKILCIKLSYVPQWWHFEFSNHLKSRLKNDHPMIMYVLFSGFWEEIKKKYFSHRILFLTFETDQFLIFSDVRFSYLALVQDKKIMCVLPANACCTVYVNCPLNSPCFSFLK